MASLTARYFINNDLSVETEHNGANALQKFRSCQPDLVILDLMLPGMDGLSICRELRKEFAGPILILTAKDAAIDEVICLEAGADDYVSKPAEPMVLLARVRGLLRRLNQQTNDHSTADEISIGQLRISVSAQEAWLDNEKILLSTQEFDLLTILARNAGKILSRDDLMKNTRGIDYNGIDRSIDIRVSKLRKKLGDDPNQPQKVKTVWGKGYLLSPENW